VIAITLMYSGMPEQRAAGGLFPIRGSRWAGRYEAKGLNEETNLPQAIGHEKCAATRANVVNLTTSGP
jgi:hypothetical protein